MYVDSLLLKLKRILTEGNFDWDTGMYFIKMSRDEIKEIIKALESIP